MGNVSASSIPPPPPQDIIPPPPPPSSSEEPKVKPLNETEITNPGPMEDLHKKCKDVFPVNFEGAKIMLSKGLSNHFQISHSLNMSSITPSGYRFGATYVGTKQFSPNEAFPVMLGDIDPSGNMNANIIHQFTPQIRTKMVAQVQENKFVATQFTGDYKGDSFTASCSAGNIDVVNKSGIIVGQYLQNVTPNVALGAEIAYQYGPHVPGGEIAVLSGAARYTGHNYIISGTLGMVSAHMCYYHRGSETTQVGVEVETNFRVGESQATIGYQVDLPRANLVFRGQVDSNWTVGAVLEKRLQPLPFVFTLSGMINHVRNQSRFGVGLMIG